MSKITSKPNWGTPIVKTMRLNEPFQTFFDTLVQRMNDFLLKPTGVRVPSYTVANLPAVPAASQPSIIYVSNESGGPVLAFSDGTDWRRVTDRAVVS